MDDQLKFEQQKWAEELDLRNRELAIKENASKPSVFQNPIVVTVLSAIVAGLVGIVTNFIDSSNKIALEERKFDLNLLTSLIQVRDQDLIRKNLEFLVKAKIIRNGDLRNDIDNYLKTVDTKDLPAITNQLITSENVSSVNVCSDFSGATVAVSVVPLTDEALAGIGRKFSLDIPTLKTFLAVESVTGRLARGHPKILFERHYFHRLTQGRFDNSHPEISNEKWGGYKGGYGEYTRLREAVALDCHAALSSTSWGSGQIMGDNYKAAGFTSVEDFARAMLTSEPEALQATLNYVKSNNLLDPLRNHDWEAFARGYNGPGYRNYQYDVKLKAAYAQYSKGEQR